VFRVTSDPWTEARLAELGSTEHDFLEFKGSQYVWSGGELSAGFMFGLSKQISAFANGAGGRIILGLDDHGLIDGGVPARIKPCGTREWLEDIVPGLVAPKLSRFNVFEVPWPGPDAPSSLAQGHAVYIIEIPPSVDAPHQSVDHRYYLRIAGKSRPMGHVHIQDVLRRAVHPDVELVRLGPFGEPEFDRSDPRGPRAFVCFRAFLRNRGRSLARHAGAEIILPRPLVGPEVRARNMALEGVHLTQSPGEFTFFRYHPVPLFPTQQVFFMSFWIGIHSANLESLRQGLSLRWRVYADDARPLAGEHAVASFGVVARALDWVADQRD
jgi:hypothetical protein